jgi:hypothetical protein
VATTRTSGAARTTPATSSAAAPDVLAVVHHQQELLVAEVRVQERLRLGRRLVPEVEGRDDRVAHQRRIAHLGQLDEPRAAREATSQLGRDADGEPALADASGPDQAYDPRRPQLRSQLGELAAAADEAGRLRREVACAAGWPGHRRERTLAPRCGDSVSNRQFHGLGAPGPLSRLTGMNVRVSGALLRFTEYRRVVSVDAPTVRAALDKLAGEYQPLRKVLFDRAGNVRAAQRIFLNGEPLEADQLGVPAGESDCVELLLAISGG